VVYRLAWLNHAYFGDWATWGGACWVYTLPNTPLDAAPISCGAETSVKISGALDALNEQEHR
jgi:hypothetical protein